MCEEKLWWLSGNKTNNKVGYMLYLTVVADLLCRYQYNWNLGSNVPKVIMWLRSIIPLIEEELSNEERNVWK